MEKEKLQPWLTTVAKELSNEATKAGIKGALHFDVYDDHGHGRVCSFEMSGGKVAWWTWTEALTLCEWPLKLVLTGSDGSTRKLWVGERDWRRAA
jgi:hypothetical protein